MTNWGWRTTITGRWRAVVIGSAIGRRRRAATIHGRRRTMVGRRVTPIDLRRATVDGRRRASFGGRSIPPRPNGPRLPGLGGRRPALRQRPPLACADSGRAVVRRRRRRGGGVLLVVEQRASGSRPQLELAHVDLQVVVLVAVVRHFREGIFSSFARATPLASGIPNAARQRQEAQAGEAALR